MDHNKQEIEEIVNLVQKFMQDYYKLRAKHIRNTGEQRQVQTGDAERERTEIKQVI